MKAGSNAVGGRGVNGASMDLSVLGDGGDEDSRYSSKFIWPEKRFLLGVEFVSNRRPSSFSLSVALSGSATSVVGETLMGLAPLVSSSSQLGKTVFAGEPERALRVPDPDETWSSFTEGRELRRLDLLSFLML